MKRDLKLYRFYADFRRMGDLEGVFLADQREVDLVLQRSVHFGEVLGKHSDITVDFADGDGSIVLISDNPDVVEVVWEHRLWSGFNPVSRYRSNLEDDFDVYDGQRDDEFRQLMEEFAAE